MMAVMRGPVAWRDWSQPTKPAALKGRPTVTSVEAPLVEDSTNTDSDNDIALLEKSGRGDREAFARLYDRLSGPLFSLALKMLGDRAEAEDALLEGLEAIWKQAPRFDASRASAFSWSVMVFRARTIDRVRRRASQSRIRAQAATEMDPGDSSSILNRDASIQTVKREEWDIVRRAVESLEADRAELLRWSFFDGLTHQEIAEKSGRPLGTVKTSIRRSLLELRSIILGRGYEP